MPPTSTTSLVGINACMRAAVVADRPSSARMMRVGHRTADHSSQKEWPHSSRQATITSTSNFGNKPSDRVSNPLAQARDHSESPPKNANAVSSDAKGTRPGAEPVAQDSRRF